ncbi:MAG: preprotein translocase subunit SecY [Candidatus Altiarchaeota archaeon]|nr:preprotein translocase subunit SecY [Candidatus Altiarchaeota archaeon]
MNLEFVRPLIKYIPEIRLPKRHVPFKEKLIWTSAVLALFFIMGTVYPLHVSAIDFPPSYRMMQIVFASSMGSIISVGIGPIVTASIVLQLLVGAKMLDVDLTTNDGKALFQATQKILTVIIAIFEAAAIVIGFGLGSKYLESIGVQWSLNNPIVLAAIGQIALGSIMLMYLDEIVSKWGIGSGIGLFIAGGVSQTILSGSMNVLGWIDGARWEGELGYIPQFLAGLLSGTDMFDLFILIFPVLATIIVFLVVVYAESMRLEIPLSYGGIRGVGGRYPLKFFYVSNIPVILAAALLANVQMLPTLVGISSTSSVSWGDMNMLQQAVVVFVQYVTMNGAGHSLNGILSPNSIHQLINPLVLLHLLIYALVFTLLCIVFGKFWVETTGLGPEQVADQIQRGGMQIPGFRRDKRVVERVLNRYIPQISLISSVAVGLLAVGADLLGAIGSGTGILLTVGILYRLHEELQKEQMADMHPAFRRLFGKA